MAENLVPFVCLYDQMQTAISTLVVSNMKAVEHEDNDFNSDYSVDPLADPRLDRMDLFNMVDTKDRDAIMNAQPSYNIMPGDELDLNTSEGGSVPEATSGSGSGE